MTRDGANLFGRCLDNMGRRAAAGFDAHLVMDNYVTHEVSKFQAWLARQLRFHVHFTPAGSLLQTYFRLRTLEGKQKAAIAGLTFQLEIAIGFR